MLKINIFIFSFLLLIIGGFGANVEINSNIGMNETIFNYYLDFTNSNNYNSFSFEKPKNSIIISAIDSNNNSLFYSSAGDFFIFKVNPNSMGKYYIKFKSKQVSEELDKNNVFKVYTNFNFPVENLTFKLNMDFSYGEIEDIFPREYIMQDQKIVWKLNNLGKDILFMVNFNYVNNSVGDVIVTKSSNTIFNDSSLINILNYFWSNPIILILTISILFIVVLIYIYRKTMRNLLNFKREVLKKELSKNILKSKDIDDSSLMVDELNDDSNIVEEVKMETFNEYVSKYLTENELDVVNIVKDNEGLIQNEILSNINGMTKSNLSKIITKLDSKKILKRIRVGKVNKIYLGEKLEKFKSNNEV